MSSKAIALEIIGVKGGRLVEEKGDNITMTSPILVECSQHHTWKSFYSRICAHHWCPYCCGTMALTLEEMQEIALARGGKCLSTEYIGNKNNLQWECSFGHTWYAAPMNVKNKKTWCPECNINVGEELVRATLEEAFPGNRFRRTRSVPWMCGLELDGYNENLSLAFEYQGIQHFEFVSHFHKTQEDFEALIKRDELTLERCDDNYVTLLIVPYTIKFDKIRAFVREFVEDIYTDVAPITCSDEDFYCKIRANSARHELQLAKFKEICEKKGGVCLEDRYLGHKIPMKIKCNVCEGVFLASLSDINQKESRGPRFCTLCHPKKVEITPEFKKATLERFGYEYLGPEERISPTSGELCSYMKVRCAGENNCGERHEYSVHWNNFYDSGNDTMKKGCKKCSDESRGKAKRNDISKWSEQTGIINLDPYTTRTEKIRWKCSKGHIYATTLANMKERSHLCRRCGLDEIVTANNWTIVTDLQTDPSPSEKFEWRCDTHGKTFYASIMMLARSTNKNKCPECT